MLKVNDFPPIYIPTDKRENYLDALNEGNYNSNYAPLIDFIIDRMFATFAYLAAKSDIRKTIKSDGYSNWFSSKFDAAIYNKMITQIEYYVTTVNDP